jgi:hypothetical protein
MPDLGWGMFHAAYTSFFRFAAVPGPVYKNCTWVPEGSLAGFLLGAFLKSGRPRRPGNALQNAGGEAPHILEGLPGPPGPARPQKGTPKKYGQTAFRNPAYCTQ